MKNFAVVMLAVASVFALSSSAQAGGGGGGGGAKKNAKIKVTVQVPGATAGGFIVDTDPARVYNTAAEFQAAGGIILNAQGTGTLDVTAGVHNLLIYDFTGGFPAVAPAGARTTPSIPKNKTLKALVTPGAIQFSY